MRFSGFEVKRIDTDYPDEFERLWAQITPYTMTPKDRAFGLYQAVHYILDNQITGDFVECGVWRGGSAMLIALILEKRAIKDRKIFLFDTYEGMTEPEDNDVDQRSKKSAYKFWQRTRRGNFSDWCYASLTEVQQNMARTGIAADRVTYIKGPVEETIPHNFPSQLALLRLDTDWYASTKHSLDHCFDLVSAKGVLIIDDYGYWQGAQEASDEFFKERGIKPFLHRLDFSGRLYIKD